MDRSADTRTSVLAADSCRPMGDFVSCENLSLWCSRYKKDIELHAGTNFTLSLSFLAFAYIAILSDAINIFVLREVRRYKIK